MGRGTPPERRRVRAFVSAESILGVSAGNPFVETERLLLRQPRADDFADYFALVGDPDAFRYCGRGAMTREEAWSRLLRQVGHWSLLGYGLFAVAEKASGRFVGEVGLGDFHRGFGPRFDDAPEACWTIARRSQGRGYATEAAAAAHDWMERRFGTERTVCLIQGDNAPSLAVAHKLGYRPVGARHYRGYCAIVHERAQPPG